MPKNTTEALQDQVEQLIKENEKLKAATGRPSSPALSPSEPETLADRERLRVDKSKPLITPPAPPRSGRTLDCHFKPATPELEKTTPPPAVFSDPLHAYIVGSNRPVLEDNAPVKASKTEIDKWIKANIKDKARLTKLEGQQAGPSQSLPSYHCLGLGPQVGPERHPECPHSHAGHGQRPRRLMVSTTLPDGLC